MEESKKDHQESIRRIDRNDERIAVLEEYSLEAKEWRRQVDDKMDKIAGKIDDIRKDQKDYYKARGFTAKNDSNK